MYTSDSICWFVQIEHKNARMNNCSRYSKAKYVRFLCVVPAGSKPLEMAKVIALVLCSCKVFKNEIR